MEYLIIRAKTHGHIYSYGSPGIVRWSARQNSEHQQEAFYNKHDHIPGTTPSTTIFERQIRMHMLPRADTVSESGQFPCHLPDCPLGSQKFIREEHLNQHRIKYHNYNFPVECPVHGCQREKLDTFIDLEDHMQHDHLDPIRALAHRDTHIQCPVHECGFDCPRTSPDILVKHIRSAHQKNDRIVLPVDHHGDGKHACLVPDCSSTDRFHFTTGNLHGSSDYDRYLIRDHDLLTVASRQLYKSTMYTSNATWLSIYLPQMVVTWDPTTEGDHTTERLVSNAPDNTEPVLQVYHASV